MSVYEPHTGRTSNAVTIDGAWALVSCHLIQGSIFGRWAFAYFLLAVVVVGNMGNAKKKTRSMCSTHTMV